MVLFGHGTEAWPRYCLRFSGRYFGPGPTRREIRQNHSSRCRAEERQAESRRCQGRSVHNNDRTAKWRSLHEVLTHVLAKSSKPLTAQELADRVTASGYESKSKDLKNVIWVSIGKLATVERVPGEGYRLKKGRGDGSKRKG